MPILHLLVAGTCHGDSDLQFERINVFNRWTLRPIRCTPGSLPTIGRPLSQKCDAVLSCENRGPGAGHACVICIHEWECFYYTSLYIQYYSKMFMTVIDRVYFVFLTTVPALWVQQPCKSQVWGLHEFKWSPLPLWITVFFKRGNELHRGHSAYGS